MGGPSRRTRRSHFRAITAPSKREWINGQLHPSFSEVLDLFLFRAPEDIACPKEVCYETVRRAFEQYGVYPKTVADLELIFSVPSQRAALTARCWVCLYRAFRQRFMELNGIYPGPDVPNGFGESEGVAGSRQEAALTSATDTTPSPFYDAFLRGETVPRAERRQ